ncbi:DUF4832 domain-containing protein [Ferruginibacter paludis]|uniref:DUF4832 domain-containing protein n=1 Tax=Ferruginibacter paludis TaxID=1310417 RepID=UPI0025B56D5E|nr:DUF4832 domain-containing protein [Ferruginibacter paludis]MDN3657930.1 DUF4832 domain-containing protein [Ferruginibacter paludis]
MTKFVFVLSGIFTVMIAAAQNKTIVYKESQEDIVNPERGFYIPSGTRASNFVVLDAEKLKAYRNNPQRSSKASYTVKVSLIYRGYELDTFKNQPLSAAFLANLQKDFDAVRAAGVKMILRFAYTNTSHEGNCGDEYKICPPYGDAPRNITLNHIQQLKPLLQHNADVIAVLQEGFIGIWGENYFTDYFGDASNSGIGKVLDSSWRHRNELLQALLDALPKSRMVQVRTPQIKQKFVYGPSAPTTSAPLQLTAAFNNSDASRIGFHNDCFLSGEDDYGTFYDYGSSSQQRQPANAVLRKYIEVDTKFTVVGGETCDDSFSPQNDCAPAGHAEKEMRSMHYSYLNAAYNNDVNNDWDSSGCLDNIKRNLGYRFVLRKAILQQQLSKASPIAIDFTIANLGYAAAYNPRPVKIILRNITTKKEYAIVLKADLRLWFSGTHHIQEKLQLPLGINPGNYQLLLFLPDAAETLAGRSEYAVMLANENMVEKATGYNDLHHTIRIK